MVVVVGGDFDRRDVIDNEGTVHDNDDVDDKYIIDKW